MRKPWILFFVLLLQSCYEKFPYETGMFPEEPVNFLELNTPFDEMNSDYNPSTSHKEIQFVYSSNAKKEGRDFDFESRFLRFSWNKETGVLSPIVLSQNTQGFTDFYNKVQELQSDCNEKGPYSYYEHRGNLGLRYVLFSRDCGGKHKIFGREFFETTSNSRQAQNESIFRLFNEDVNEMYPSFMGDNFSKNMISMNSQSPEWMVFSSDQSGNYNLYQLKIPANQNPFDFLTSNETKEIKSLDRLNSSGNDHSPYVDGNLMVFASDRPGGFGGYDLYYSIYDGTNWSEPLNFGPTINSAYDEFRPIVFNEDYYAFNNNLMIFSSNRPGGMGGFDLYYVGVSKQ